MLGIEGQLDELLAGEHLDPLDRAEALGDPLADDDRGRRRSHDEVAELAVGEPVVDRHERLVRQRGAEQRDRHDLGVQVHESDPFAGPLGEERAGSTGPDRQLGHGDAGGPRTQRGPLPHAVSGHLQQHAEVHDQSLNPTTSGFRP